MGLARWLIRLLLPAPRPPKVPKPPDASLPPRRVPAPPLTMVDLASRLGLTEAQLADVKCEYTEFTIPKRSGKRRTIHAPIPQLKHVQRLIDKRIFGGIRVHDAATGFVRGQSFVTHAAWHAGQAVVVRFDLKDFFPSIKRWRVVDLCRWIGWEDAAAERIADLCTHQGSLPQGAPSSPRLANILSIGMDRRLVGVARVAGARYSRYADDLTFSFAVDDQTRIHALLGTVKLVVWDFWHGDMQLHDKAKLHIRRGHNRQEVTGLVVNSGVPRLPRETRRWLRAVRHRADMGSQAPKPCTLTPTQLAGWEALEQMIERQGTT